MSEHRYPEQRYPEQRAIIQALEAALREASSPSADRVDDGYALAVALGRAARLLHPPAPSRALIRLVFKAKAWLDAGPPPPQIIQVIDQTRLLDQLIEALAAEPPQVAALLDAASEIDGFLCAAQALGLRSRAEGLVEDATFHLTLYPEAASLLAPSAARLMARCQVEEADLAYPLWRQARDIEALNQAPPPPFTADPGFLARHLKAHMGAEVISLAAHRAALSQAGPARRAASSDQGYGLPRIDAGRVRCVHQGPRWSLNLEATQSGLELALYTDPEAPITLEIRVDGAPEPVTPDAEGRVGLMLPLEEEALTLIIDGVPFSVKLDDD
ncbi:hypothetical protein KKB55_04120 [Myxococcota bacterium]|nr:hypothetical protein [Myxococcota bacterium]MBU1896937.1 hypothetical protein [Myxococcota bacterium]